MTDVLNLLPGRPRVLALGEPTFGEEAPLDLRNDLFRELVERGGYRTIALESDCVRGLIVDDYVTLGVGDLDDVMERGFSHGFGAFAANRELVRWMRAYNEGRSDRVRFAGFDGPLEMSAAASPREALHALHAYLSLPPGDLDQLLGSDERWTNPAAMMDPSASVGRTAGALRLRVLADDLATMLETRSPHLIATTSREEWERARMYARTAVGLLRYHAGMADGGMAGLLDLRAAMMAANLLAIAERGPVLVHAHNGHLQRTRSTMRMGAGPLEWWSAGAITGARLGADYAFVAMAVGTIHHHGVGTPPADTIEGLLYALPGDRFVTGVPGGTTVPRDSAWYGYSALGPGGYDAIAFLRDVTRGESRPGPR